ncbi:nucleoside-diphosphate-sugar epimerase [Thermoplasmatales archaeon SCGC AB-539-N05]|nr:nucleoside-diphosphate-sugar epimerase [Thermoplasmatales archaeon SCGC AB-539-N05]
MRILVTGASGFIGSNLVEKLINDGNNVIGIDNDKEKKHLLKDVIGLSNFEMIWDDINDLEDHQNKLSNIDEVYHLAASADIRKSFTDPTLDLKNNVLGTNAVLEFIRKNDINKLVFSSSSSIYGVTKVTPTPEDVPDIRPISMYGSSKLANEAFIHSYSDLYGIKAWMFRFANVVGRHMHRGVISDFYHKLLKNDKELEILGDGNQEKSYFDVSDCVDGLINIPVVDGSKSVEIYNLGNTETMKVSKLAEIVCNELGVNPTFKYAGGDRGWPGDTPYTILSIKKALKVGWKPKYSCEESIRRTMKYLSDNG